MSAYVRRHMRVQNKLFVHALRDELRVNATMRERVARDLGGRIAMVTWARRQRDAKVEASCHAAKLAEGVVRMSHNQVRCDTPAQDTRFARPNRQDTLKRWKPKTDRHGQFRWAKIETLSKPKRPKSYAAPRRRQVVTVRRVPFHPVQVTADDLGRHMDCDFPPLGHLRAKLAGYSPPIHRPPI